MLRRHTPAYLSALLGMTLRAAFARPGAALAAVAMMCANNLVLAVTWVIYFEQFSSLRGWRLGDMAMLMGVVAWAFGLTVLVCGGVRDIGRTVVDGRLDIHLGRPRHPLPGLLLSRPMPSGLGDMASAPVLWLWLGSREVTDLPLLIAVSTAAAAVLCATVTIINCLVFWFPRALSLCDDLFFMLLTVAFYPQHPYGF